MIMKIIGGIGNLFLWPIHLIMAGYHDNEENSPLVALPLVIGILLPVTIPWLLRSEVIIKWNTIISFGTLWYLFIGIVSNFIAKISSGEGFVEFRRISDFKEEQV
jgi:hypothetical protein